ncbi:MAG TPA: LysR family transcriptional regulator [Xanthobacteraceae bacterium]|nr:LysR family transcriptional regulator [Xanthobacteraceae bacterium]
MQQRKQASIIAMLSWDDFRYVKAIADTRSLGGAAAELSVNHSTVFRRLAQIEKGLGSRLFERSRGGYALTPCGEEMVRLAERMGEDIVAFERQVTGHDLRPSGELRVTTNDTALIYLMTDIFAGFRHAYPEISLDVVVANQALNLSKRDADVAIRATDRPPDTLIGRRVATISWAVFAAADKAPRNFDPLTDVRNVEWIGFGDNLANLKAARWLKEHGGRVVYRINTVLGLAEATAAAMGLGLLPCFIGSKTPGLTRISPPIAEVVDGLWLLTHADLRATARVRAFMDFAGAEIAKRRRELEGTG